ncbi:E3 ubiquitin-protein ligase DTX3L [Merluccius polli]|uniref:E3 ubiquitin-protein ligase n=1 Tax=Merluccius polli TaxID=89951 RepID=A0AA47NU43_MERPO|nr:E3 ubiquitin-protein ligase DTX3L [Merluccius polli]
MLERFLFPKICGPISEQEARPENSDVEVVREFQLWRKHQSKDSRGTGSTRLEGAGQTDFEETTDNSGKYFNRRAQRSARKTPRPVEPPRRARQADPTQPTQVSYPVPPLVSFSQSAVMGSGQSSDKMHCNQYLPGHGPPTLVQQANERLNGTYKPLKLVQPDGQMTWVILHRDLPGYQNDNTIQINYIFPDGVQTGNHPHPGKPFTGLRLWAYLPDNREGRKVLQLLDKGFNQGLLFTVATNQEGVDMVSPAAVPLKTQPDGGTKIDSYPDADYLKNVRKVLKDKGLE